MLLSVCDISPLDAGYCCARAFILAEFAASLEWQLHCYLWPERPGYHPFSLLLMAAVYAGVYGFTFWFDFRRGGAGECCPPRGGWPLPGYGGGHGCHCLCGQ